MSDALRDRVLEKLWLHVSKQMANEHVECSVDDASRYLADTMVAQLRTFVWAEEVETKSWTTYPTWWDHLKASSRLLRRVFGEPATVEHRLRLMATYPTLKLANHEHQAVLRYVHSLDYTGGPDT